MSNYVAASLFTLLIAIVVIFQLALAFGMPWGALSMGGRFPGQFPPAMRFVCLIQIAILAFLGAVVLTRAGMILPEWYPQSTNVIWGVVMFSSVGLVANLFTPSKWERNIWAPVTAVLLVCSVFVAFG
jgi:hypothetical protein